MSLTPLIDVIFLLLMFFMLSSSFGSFAEIDVNLSQVSASGGAGTPAILISLRGNNWRINGQPANVETAPETLEGLKEAGASAVLITFDAQTASQTLIDATQSAVHAGLNVSVRK